MKSIRNLYKLAFLLPLMAAGGCASDAPLLDDTGSDAPEQLTLSLTVADAEVVSLDTRAADPAVSSVTVYCYDGLETSGNFLEKSTVTSGFNPSGNQIRVTVPLHKKTRSIHLVVNTTADGNNPAQIVTTDASAGVMWGRANISDVVGETATVTLLRQAAKVSVSSTASGFTLSQFAVSGTADRGYVAPAGFSLTPSSPSVPSAAVYSGCTALTDKSGEIFVFETAKEKTPKVIVKGTYNGTEGYYPIAFRTRSGSGYSETPGSYTYTPLDIVRNHIYKVEITAVRAEGWPTLAEAAKAQPDNRLTCEITDTAPEVTDIVADRDYILGVSSEVTADYNADAVITIVTSWPGDGSGTFYTVTPGASWITGVKGTPASTTVNGMTDGTNASGRKYTVTIGLQTNDKSTQDREGTITVRSGNLTRTVTIRQLGCDYKRQSTRKVTVTGIPGLTCTDWYTFVDNTLQGVLPEENYGNVARNEGLHFPAVPAYTAVYQVPKLSGDKATSISSGFTYTDKSSYFEIKLSSTAAGVATGSFKLTTSNGTVIEYPLYKTGYIHQLTAAMADFQQEENVKSGWYYYGLVKKGTLYVMDRNLGASSNLPYITTYAPFKKNTGAVGGYFKIATAKSSSVSSPNTILSKLSVSSFKIPTSDQVSAWGIAAANASGTTGESAMVATFSGDNGTKVFIPHAGYYEATSLKYETHANIWTSTLLSGNQGFDPTLSPEFGYWYLYLNVYGRIVNFSQMRFANGSGGAVPTDDSVFKYMPLRLVW